MCEPMSILGVASGLASGAMAAQGRQATARKNNKMVVDQQRAQMAQRQREMIIESNAAVKEGGKAARQQRRVVGAVRAAGEGMGGNTAALKVAEQNAQGSLSIQNAKDRAAAGLYNYDQGTVIDAQEATNKVAVNTPSRGAMFADILTSAVSGYSRFS